jgi:hypothetical protein
MEQQQADGALLASISRAVVRLVHEYSVELFVLAPEEM